METRRPKRTTTKARKATRTQSKLRDLTARRGADALRGGDCLDLESRKGKAPGGYQAYRDRTRRCFIFMNAAGLHRDLETMLHEAGHAFHSTLCRDDPLLHYRHAPIEFAEVASMTMELLGFPFLDQFYDDAGAASAGESGNRSGNAACIDSSVCSATFGPTSPRSTDGAIGSPRCAARAACSALSCL